MSGLTQLFPRLSVTSFQITSIETSDYNCIAWAAQDDQSWWWPDVNMQYYWPPDVPRRETLSAFIVAFESLGYVVCQSGDYEEGFCKIALFIDVNGMPTHAARQVSNGKWTSKCGNLEDIEHDLYDLCGQQGYGDIACYMKKPA